jgi:hypothetical protein
VRRGSEEESLFVCLCWLHMQETVKWKTPIYQFIYVKRTNFSSLTEHICMTDAKLVVQKQTDMTDLLKTHFSLEVRGSYLCLQTAYFASRLSCLCRFQWPRGLTSRRGFHILPQRNRDAQVRTVLL